jgi:putative MFS transporter
MKAGMPPPRAATGPHEDPNAPPGAGGLAFIEAAGMTPYLWALLAMLASATFFDGFDLSILGTVAPFVQQQHGLSNAEWGLVNTIIRLGAITSFFILILADRYGRRLLITLTIVGYAIFTGLTALSQTITSFTLCQFAARIFLACEFALALIIIGEEYPTRWRGMGISLLSGVSALGTIAAFLAARHVLTFHPWRTMYLVGLVPLGLIFFFRLGMRETRRFERVRSERGTQSWSDAMAGLWVPFEPRYRARSLLVTLLWNCYHVVTAPAVTFWTIHAARNLGYSPSQYGLVVAAAYLFGFLFGAPTAGFLMNRIGRKLACAGYYVCAAVAIFALFWVPRPELWVQMVLMSITIFFFLGASAATNTYATELFPTEIRATGYSWTTNLFGRIGELVTPLAIGVLADSIGIPSAVAIMAIGPIVGAVIVMRYAPETRDKTLEEISLELEPARPSREQGRSRA